MLQDALGWPFFPVVQGAAILDHAGSYTFQDGGSLAEPERLYWQKKDAVTTSLSSATLCYSKVIGSQSNADDIIGLYIYRIQNSYDSLALTH